jgi:hypothetical protein
MSAADLTKLFNNLLLKIKAEMKRQQTLKALSLIPAKDLDFPEDVCINSYSFCLISLGRVL